MFNVKLNRRGKIVRLLFVVALFTMIITGIADSFFKDAFKVVDYEEVVVSDGDTIWMLCKKFNGRVIASSTGDVGECVHHVSKMNPEQSDTLRSGDVIKMPVLAVNE